MRQIRVLGISDMTYVGTNESEYSLVLERDDGQRFMIPIGMEQNDMNYFLEFAFAGDERPAPRPVAQEPRAPEQPLQLPHYGEPNEVPHSFAALDGDDDDYDEGPFGDIESI